MAKKIKKPVAKPKQKALKQKQSQKQSQSVHIHLAKPVKKSTSKAMAKPKAQSSITHVVIQSNAQPYQDFKSLENSVANLTKESSKEKRKEPEKKVTIQNDNEDIMTKDQLKEKVHELLFKKLMTPPPPKTPAPYNPYTARYPPPPEIFAQYPSPDYSSGQSTPYENIGIPLTEAFTQPRVYKAKLPPTEEQRLERNAKQRERYHLKKKKISFDPNTKMEETDSDI